MTQIIGNNCVKMPEIGGNMNEKLQDKIFNDFPDLYQEKDLPMTQSCMCWGFECGDGWFDIIYQLSKKISEIDPKCRAQQVKEKFGGLRFYISGGNEKIDELINLAEEESYKTCENCGSKENVSQTDGWIKTLCENCRKEAA